MHKTAGRADKDTRDKINEVYNNALSAKITLGWDNLGQGFCNDKKKVKDLEDKLSAIGYLPGTIDGKYSSKTKDAVLKFQKKVMHMANPNGIVDKATMDKINEIHIEKKGTGNDRTVVLPDEVYGEVNGKSKVLHPNDKWGLIGKGGYPDGIQMTEDGRYKVAVAPRILDPNYPDNGKIWASDLNGINRKLDVVLENKSTGKINTIKCYVSDIKAHSYNEYKDNDNNASFDVESGLVQTGIAYPNSWNGKHGSAFASNNMDGSVIEFAGHSTGDFNPNDYKLIELHVYK